MAQKTMYKGINNSPIATLTALAADDDTIINVSNVAAFPPAPNIVTLGTDDSAELVHYTGTGSGRLTGCTRGFNGTTARSWAANTKVYRGFTAYDHDTFVDNINDLNATKLGKAADPTSGNLASFDADGNVVDSNKKPADFATAGQGAKADAAAKQSDLTAHTGNKTNPHAVTPAQIGAASSAQGAKADSAIQGVKVNGTTVVPDASKFVSIDFSGKADKVANPTTGNLAALDANGNPTDSGKKATDFENAGAAAAVQQNLTTHTGNKQNPHAVTPAQIGGATSAQGAKADSAIQSVKVAGTALTPDGSKAVDIPANAANGLLKLDNIGKAPLAQLPDFFTGAPNHTYDGVNLKTVFANAAALHAAVVAGDFSKIRVGDYWPVTITGSYYDYSSYTAPSGTEYFSDTSLTTSAGTLTAIKEVTYVNETYCSFKTGDVTYYLVTNGCLTYFEKTFNNAALKLEVCPQVYHRYGDSTPPNHLLMVSRDCFPVYLKMRKTNTDWCDTTATNPWLGSALYKTLNDPDHGIIALLAATDIGAYIYAGANGKGMRYLGETKAAGASSATSWGWLDRGKLFLPLECEVWGFTVWQERTYGAGAAVQWPVFAGTLKHISKGIGDGASRSYWWCASSNAGSAANFALVDYTGLPSTTGASNAFGVPACFLFT